jgi:chemotaxis methyl-accepting protein methylase
MAPEVAEFLGWVLRRAGVEPANYRQTALARRLQACLRSLHVRTIEEARAALSRQPELATAAAGALLIGVTSFFRDPNVFDYLDQKILPSLAPPGQGLRVWSAGCADGAELYSMAILLAEHHRLTGSHLLGTDCRAEALQRARRGWFDVRWLLGGLPEALRDRHFVRDAAGWRIDEAMRQVVCWAQSDLLSEPLFDAPLWDLILCRNVAIYLEPAAAASLWTRLTTRLREGGILVVGKAERPDAEQPLRRLAPCLFQKLGGVRA